MFTNSEKKLLGGGYFTIIREEEKFIEVKSRNTGHCWMIFKKTYDQDKPVVLYHKHGKTDAWYHEHKGHAKRGGGRTKAMPHIAPAEENAVKELENDIKKALGGS